MVQKVLTSQGCKSVVKDTPLDTVWTDVYSGARHPLHRVTVDTGATFVAYPLKKSNTSFYIPMAFHGINYTTKEQSVFGDYNAKVRINTLTREIQFSLLTSKIVWNFNKEDHSIVECEAVSLSALKWVAKATDAEVVVTNTRTGLTCVFDNGQNFNSPEIHDMIGQGRNTLPKKSVSFSTRILFCGFCFSLLKYNGQMYNNGQIAGSVHYYTQGEGVGGIGQSVQYPPPFQIWGAKWRSDFTQAVIFLYLDLFPFVLTSFPFYPL